VAIHSFQRYGMIVYEGFNITDCHIEILIELRIREKTILAFFENSIELDETLIEYLGEIYRMTTIISRDEVLGFLQALTQKENNFELFESFVHAFRVEFLADERFFETFISSVSSTSSTSFNKINAIFENQVLRKPSFLIPLIRYAILQNDWVTFGSSFAWYGKEEVTSACHQILSTEHISEEKVNVLKNFRII
jgi:hypothetical protein